MVQDAAEFTAAGTATVVVPSALQLSNGASSKIRCPIGALT